MLIAMSETSQLVPRSPRLSCPPRTLSTLTERESRWMHAVVPTSPHANRCQEPDVTLRSGPRIAPIPRHRGGQLHPFGA
jgi:hypothetical protein